MEAKILSKLSKVIFEKAGRSFVFEKANGYWKFGNSNWTNEELWKLIAEAQKQGFKVFMRAK
jgi:hypothetical protein